MTYRSLLLTALLLSCSGMFVSLRGEEITKSTPAPNRIRSQIVVLPANWPDKIPPTGRVNPPIFLSTVYPGQRVAVGLLSQGPDRATLFDGVTASIRISRLSRSQSEWHEVKPRAIRAIKAEGADFSLMALRAGGISASELAKMEEMTSLVTLAVFNADLVVPAADVGNEVEIRLTISGTAQPVTISPVRLEIRTAAQWLGKPAPALAQIDHQLNRDCSDLPPGQLLSWFKTLAADPHHDAPPLRALFAVAFQSNEALRAAAVDVWPKQDPAVQDALLRSLRLAGIDVGALLPTLPAEKIALLNAIAPLGDVRQLPQFTDRAELKDVAWLGSAMDQCWGAWMATGDKVYLQSIVSYLAYAEDFPALKRWKETRGGEKGLTPAVARGLGYQTAGWSLGSFMRTDPHVADWLLYWQNDTTVPETIRKQLASLMTNPAFRRN